MASGGPEKLGCYAVSLDDPGLSLSRKVTGGYKRRNLPDPMQIRLQEDLDPDTGFYYHYQFKIYHEPYLIWDQETWEAVLSVCAVYRIEADGQYAGDVILEERGRGAKYIVDFSLLPEYQRRGIGKAVLEEVKKTGKRITAVTRKETIQFFLKSGFVLKKRLKDYYDPGVDGYYIVFLGKRSFAP